MVYLVDRENKVIRVDENNEKIKHHFLTKTLYPTNKNIKNKTLYLPSMEFNDGEGEVINKIFVYGTLKRNFGNNSYMYLYHNVVNRVISGEVKNMALVGSGVPFMIYKKGFVVRGEIFEYKVENERDVKKYNKMLNKIDRLEGFSMMSNSNTFYQRFLCEVKDGKGNKHLCWAYYGIMGEKNIIDFGEEFYSEYLRKY